MQSEPRPGHPTGGHRCRTVVDLSSALSDGHSPGARARPAGQLPARVIQLAPGAVDLAGIVGCPDDWIGLLVLDGLLVVELEAGRAHTGWLVGADDLVRPWDREDISLLRAASCRALTPARVALLDGPFNLRAGGVPGLARTLVARTARTTSWLLAKALVLSCPVVEERLLLAFALFGERWGTVRQEGVLLKLPLTHALLASLCGVRRPSVTVALGSLEQAGLLTRSTAGWLLNRHPPELNGSRPSCWAEYAAALGLADRPAELTGAPAV